MALIKVGFGGKFVLGKMVITCGVRDFCTENPSFNAHVMECLQRHGKGDWGNVSEDDKKLNDQALIEGTRLWSGYEKPGYPRIIIITEADRSATTVLFPGEY